MLHRAPQPVPHHDLGEAEVLARRLVCLIGPAHPAQQGHVRFLRHVVHARRLPRELSGRALYDRVEPPASVFHQSILL